MNYFLHGKPKYFRPGRGGLVVLVMGGREVGQVNMFQRNISLWKLVL